MTLIISEFAAILSPAFLNDCITFFGTIGKGIVSLFQKFVTGADSFGQLSNEISNRIVSGIADNRDWLSD